MRKNELYKEIDGRRYAIDATHDGIFDINKKRRKDNIYKLKAFVIKECYAYWATQPRELSTLKKQYLKELTDALE